jgi:hypothetical protein
MCVIVKPTTKVQTLLMHNFIVRTVKLMLYLVEK